ncbi:hypothetical protein K8352_00310 [Flavobacteriaceae bacterium F89]|uniref:Uncharacterized protein n=1 Tax=Cerina litoralis TaxID=2874477 RepID=A0AAE3JR20_9FLAO|nr:hypothetical protein [Cerina litoralis]MCG2459182.1 hypothetical protein [Cerina litoralis]
MTKPKERPWFWNILIVITIILVLSVFTAHYKNWTKIKNDRFRILSGFYKKEIQFSELDSVVWVAKIPPMIRLNGFSAMETEKGIYQEFKDSLTDKTVDVFVDNLSDPKIKLVYRDSLKLFFNLSDSTDTKQLYQQLTTRIDSLPKK